MESWLITRYLLARFQQLRELSSGFLKAKLEKDSPLLAGVVRDSWLRAVGSIEILWLRCVLGLPDTRWTRRLKVSTVLRRATRLRVESPGTLGAGTPGGHG